MILINEISFFNPLVLVVDITLNCHSLYQIQLIKVTPVKITGELGSESRVKFKFINKLNYF